MRHRLIRLLRGAHSGERAAALAYRSHAECVGDPGERSAILEIERDEHDHRERVGRMLKEIGSRPDPVQERVADLVGRAVAAACPYSGWFFPMYVAARLERGNIAAYEQAARYAAAVGWAGYIGELRAMADTERRHEAWFHAKAASHRLWAFVPQWTPTPAAKKGVPAPS